MERHRPFTRCGVGIASFVSVEQIEPQPQPSAKILQWRPRKQLSLPGRPPTKLPEYPLWSMSKKSSRIDCAIQDLGIDGWRAVFRFNGDWLFGCRYQSWEEAIVATDAKHVDLKKAGWVRTAVQAAR